MGRATYGTAVEVSNGQIYLFRVRLHDGYDDGGAYWGAAIDGVAPLYCARTGDAAPFDDGTYLQFVRARSRREAAEKLSIPERKLKRKTEAFA